MAGGGCLRLDRRLSEAIQQVAFVSYLANLVDGEIYRLLAENPQANGPGGVFIGAVFDAFWSVRRGNIFTPHVHLGCRRSLGLVSYVVGCRHLRLNFV